MSILFVTNRNVINTCGELRLIKNRAVCLQEEYGIKTDFLVCRSDKCLHKTQEEIGAGSTLTKFFYADKNPFSLIKQFALLKKAVLKSLAQNEYEAVILSGNLVLPLAKVVKKKFPEVNLIIDVHGAIEELVEFRGNGLLKNTIRLTLFRVLKAIEKKYMRYADGIFAVSIALQNYLVKEYGLQNKQFFIVPCAQGCQELDREEKLSNRRKYREKYGVGDDEKLFIYSGGLSPWQCIEDSVRLFRMVQQQDNKVKLLLLTGNVEAIRKYEGENVMVDSLPFNLVNEVICAGDYAFMLRDDFITNNVAYPNKFIEYVASGMKVLTTPYVHDVAEQVANSDIGYIITKETENGLMDYVKQASEYMEDISARQALLDDVCFENRLKELVKNLGKECK